MFTDVASVKLKSVEERVGMNTYRPVALGALLPALVMPADSAGSAPLPPSRQLAQPQHRERPAMECTNMKHLDFAIRQAKDIRDEGLDSNVTLLCTNNKDRRKRWRSA